jgi:hypothetical protein
LSLGRGEGFLSEGVRPFNTAVFEEGGEPFAAHPAYGGGGLVVGDQREGASPVQVESSLQRREQGQKRLPEAGDTSGAVGDKVAPSGEEKLKFGEITFAGGEPAEVASHSSLIGDDVGISGVGL